MSWRDWFSRSDPIEEELASHLRMAIDERIARGESPADAERNARRELGNLTHVSEVTREQRLGPIALLNRLWQEARVAVRSLLAARAFTLGTVGCWALAIAAHGAMLAIMDQIFVRSPAHVRDPSQVVRLYRRMEVPGRPVFTTPAFVFPAADALRRDGGRVAEFAAFGAFEQSAELPGGFRNVRGSAITRNYFSLLGVSPALGAFPVDGLPALDSCSDGAVISHALWTSAFGGEASAIGRAMRVGDRSLPVCAVAPAGFTGGDPANPEVWVPVEVAGAWAGGPKWREYEEGKLGLFNIVARIHWFGGVDATEVAAVAKQIVEPFDGPMPAGVSRNVTVIAASLVPGRAPGALAQNRTIIWLGGAATLLLLLATLNVSTMLLLRTLERQPEFALRRVLGASGGTIARYVTLEVVAIGIAGAAVGLFFAQLLRPVLQQLIGVDAIPIPLSRIVTIEGTALLVASVIASVPPILAALSAHRSFAYRNDPRSTASARAGRTRTALLVLQVVSCVVLVAGALVMGASLKAVRALDLGLDASRVLVASLDMRYARSLGKPTTEALMRELSGKVASLPGVRAHAVANRTPFGMAFGMATFDEQRQLIKLPDGGVPLYTSATHGFFAAIGATVTRGRVITPADEQSAARVVVVNASFAGFAYPGSDPVGRCIFLGSPEDGPCFRIVGVIADQRRFSVLPEEPMMELYMPESHGKEYGAPPTQVILRTDGDPAALAPEVERIARSVFPPAAPILVQPLARRLDPQVRPWIAGTRLLGIYSIVAFIVATAGIFGTLAYLTRLARRATAIRMALGATQLGATMSVARTGIATTLVGLAIGGGAALALRTQAGALLFGIERAGLVSLVVQAMALVGIAGAIASLVPAWRGSRADVFRSLNAE